MTTPRDEGAAGTDPQQTDYQQPAPPAPAHEPPAFPSVGGDSDSPTRIDHQPAFTRVGEQPASLAPAMPVATTEPAVSTNSNARWRWVAAGLATILLLAVVVGAFLFLGARRPATPSPVAQYVPASPAAYVEVRLDFPGDQRDRLTSFMTNFPGFADPASFQLKIDDTLASALRSSGTGLDWEADVKPWFGGMIGMFLMSDPLTMSQSASVSDVPAALIFSVKDGDVNRGFITDRLAATGVPQEDYKGSTLWPAIATPSGDPLSAGLTNEALVISPRLNEVKAALDAEAGDTQGLADDAFFTAQLSELSADHLGLFYYDYREVLDQIPAPTGLPGVLPENCMSDLASAAGVKLLGALRAESDHMLLEVRAQAPPVEGFPQYPNRASTLAQSMPGDTVAYFENRALGQTIKYYVSQLLECLPSDGTGFNPNQLQQMLGTAPEDYFDFLEDVGIAVTLRDGKFGGGVIATVNDEAVAQVRVERLVSAVRLAAGVGEGITIDEQLHGAETITVINLGDQLVPGTDIPSLSLSVARGRLYVGIDDFVSRALDQGEADSLASAPRLQSALNAGGRENAAFVYVDVAALRGFIEGMIPSDERSEYDAEFKPFVEPITQLVLVGRNEQGIYSSNVFLYVE